MNTDVMLDQTSRDLLAAADYIDQHGWCQHAFKTQEGQVCLLGALGVVAVQAACKTLSSNELDFLCQLYSSSLVNDRFDRAKERLRTYLEKNLGNSSIPMWNDYVATSKEQVTALLRKAAYAC